TAGIGGRVSFCTVEPPDPNCRHCRPETHDWFKNKVTVGILKTGRHPETPRFHQRGEGSCVERYKIVRSGFGPHTPCTMPLCPSVRKDTPTTALEAELLPRKTPSRKPLSSKCWEKSSALSV